ncbi:type IV secretory pathway VirD2 relaxase [Pusillimonas noertemannii]|uniref:Type IV secretory pathway VirD2 relaxase n=2 Tax=Pusillimonas noertemannii TaxID=305977 RepID=A0A2U1CM76_9BURK|nr:relaxase/mobilization nuclease and DUF3363 domain-containing protein [Pusillimonas noertemannii]NYT68859.1 relaxase/mobilization nuclease and DUF3363 domain-containing protein [Pusillimonas noertemannii]PVY62120.1 type IV secretory pathway VirD2 relaxase [Pusillimonas noertemannii]TFL11105.1 DUF3363 domain-containing protein [Pusillimonas noertemannii]
MARGEEDRFRPRPAPPKHDRSAGGERYVAKVLRQVSRSGPTWAGAASPRSGANFGRGRVAARFAPAEPSPRMRRVVIKSRFVKVMPGGDGIGRHLRYICRDGVTREGQAGRAYGADTEDADTRAFEARSRNDRHQFRFIVSPEDAQELGDLKAYTRALMARMAVDLETRLDWVAVDHWDTDNPHTHIVLRGRADNGQDLVIAPDYMSHGMRVRAADIATEWLGPRTQREIAHSLTREIEQKRYTTLDRNLMRQAVVDVVDARELRGDLPYQAMLRARLQRLSGLGLATRLDPNRWQLDGRLEATLRGLGDRSDIIRTLHRAMRGQAREFVIHAPERESASVIGRIAAKGLADELHDTGYLIVDGVDGRAHYIGLPFQTDIADYPAGGIVEIRPIQDSAADCNIAAVARDGLYRTTDHLTSVKGRDSDPERIVQSHVRRLEALRRAGIVQRVAEGAWKIPDDLRERGRAFDLQRTGGVAVALRTHLPLARQTRALGATWLDTQLIGEGRDLAATGFGAQVREAMQARGAYLETQGLAQRRGERFVLARDLLRTLRTRELDAAAKTITSDTGLVYRPLGERGTASGIYRRSIMVASGRYAVLEQGPSFTLVPWRPVIEQRLGQSLAVSIQAGRATWSIGRSRSLSR